MFKKKVIVKLQRPIAGDDVGILSYLVDEDGEQMSNPQITEMPHDQVETLFGDHFKIYYTGRHRNGKPVELRDPTWQDEWV